MVVAKDVLRSFVPTSLLAARQRRKSRVMEPAPATAGSNAEIFAAVYRNGRWGSAADADFDSGEGSHDERIYRPYLSAVGRFLDEFASPPDVVDLGCGDFTVSQRLRPHCGRFTACDVVPELIQRNATIYEADNVDFRCIDIARDELPQGDVVILRQVLQHLCNHDIAQVLTKLGRYRFAIITEHVPVGRFVPNLDMPTGEHVRLGMYSGVDVTRPPFSFAYRDSQQLCAVQTGRSRIVTTLFRLADDTEGSSL